MTRREYHRVPDELYGQIARKLDDLRRRILEGNLSPELSLHAIQGILEGTGFYADKEWLFSPPYAQAFKLFQWNKDLGWGFDPDSIELPDSIFARRATTFLDDEECDRPIPLTLEGRNAQNLEDIKRHFDIDNRHLRAVVLVPYFETPEITFRRLAEVLEMQQGNKATNYLMQNAKDFTLAEGVDYPGRCLRWEMIDFGATEVKEPKKLAHAGVLASAIYSPQWLAAMYLKIVPPVLIGGYRATFKSEKCEITPRLTWSERFLPSLNFQPTGSIVEGLATAELLGTTKSLLFKKFRVLTPEEIAAVTSPISDPVNE